MKKEHNIVELLKEIKGIELGKVHYRNILLDLKRLYKERDAFEDLLDIKLERLKGFESNNLISLFNKMVGRHTKVLELHKQEYLRVTLEYNEVTKSVSLLEYEKKLIEDKIDKELELRSLLKSRLKNLESGIRDEDVMAFRSLYQSIEDQSKLLKEIEEAIKACEEAAFLIQSAEDYLKRGEEKSELIGISIEMILDKNYFDITLLQELISKIKFKLQEFEHEMSDLYGHLDLRTFETHQYSENFGKMFREVVLLDWQNNDSVYNSIEFLENYKQSMLNNQKVLSKDLTEVKASLTALESKVDELLKR